MLTVLTHEQDDEKLSQRLQDAQPSLKRDPKYICPHESFGPRAGARGRKRPKEVGKATPPAGAANCTLLSPAWRKGKYSRRAHNNLTDDDWRKNNYPEYFISLLSWPLPATTILTPPTTATNVFISQSRTRVWA